MRWTALMSSSRARRERVHLSVQAGPGHTAEVSPSCRASAMGNALAVPVQAEPGLAAVAAPSFHRSVRAGQRVHRSTRAGPGRIASSERDGQRVRLPVLAGPGHIAAETMWVKRARGEHFVSSECNGQRVHRSRPGAHTVKTKRRSQAEAHDCTRNPRGWSRIVPSERDGQRVHRRAAP